MGRQGKENKWKTEQIENNKMADLSPNIVTLDVNNHNVPIKKQRMALCIKKMTQLYSVYMKHI